jgi:hypothetical protein
MGGAHGSSWVETTVDLVVDLDGNGNLELDEAPRLAARNLVVLRGIRGGPTASALGNVSHIGFRCSHELICALPRQSPRQR